MSPSAPQNAQLQPSELPMRLGRYMLYEILGQGGYATVYRAELEGPGGFRKGVAIKMLQQHVLLTAPTQRREALIREARLGGLLHHRNVVNCYELGDVDGQVFLSMELIDGLSLDELLAQGALPSEVAIQIGIDLCRGLAYAHELSLAGEPLCLVHRDLKPGNVLIGWDGTVKIADFGIAKLQGLGKEGGAQIVGSPGYMSPEQSLGQELDYRSDLFAMGLLLYEMVTGKRLLKVRKAGELPPIPTAEALQKAVGVEGMGDVIARCLYVDPSQRYTSATELRVALRALVSQPDLDLIQWLHTVLPNAQVQATSLVREIGEMGDVTGAVETVVNEMSQEALGGCLQQIKSASDRKVAIEAYGRWEELAMGSDESSPEIASAMEAGGFEQVCEGTHPALLVCADEGEFWWQGRCALTFRPHSLSARLLQMIATEGAALNRSSLYVSVWEQEYRSPHSDNALYVRLHRLRQKLRDCGLSIENHASGGYALGGNPSVYRWRGTSTQTNSETTGPKTNLVPAAESFYGRSAELESLRAWLGEGGGVMTVLGPPGTGKTRLCRQAAEGAWREFPHWAGVWFCDLTEARTEAEFVGALALALDTRIPVKEPVNRMAAALGKLGSCLLILDNAEQLVEVVAEYLVRLTKVAPEVRVLVTSRVPLASTDETLRLAPLPLPDGQANIAENPAVALFVDRARKVKATFSLSESNRDDVAALVEALDGLPLAIELAAARISLLSPRQIHGRLSDRFRLLNRKQRGATRRETTLQGSFDVSWDLLKPWEQAAFVQCAVFQGGFTFEAAEAVLDLSAWQAPWVIDVISTLCDYSLLVLREEQGVPRLSFYASVHEYASNKRLSEGSHLGMDSEFDRDVRRRHALWYSQYGVEPQPIGPKAKRYPLMEHRNLMAALHFADSQSSPETVVRLHRATMKSAGHARSLVAALTLSEPFLRHPRMTDEQRLQVHHIHLGLYQHLGDADEIVRMTQVVVDLARQVGNQEMLLFALSARAERMRRSGDLTASEEAFRQVLAKGEELALPRVVGSVQARLATLLTQMSQYVEAATLFQSAVASYRETGNLRVLSSVLVNLGNLYSGQVQYERAISTYEEAYRNGVVTGDLIVQGMARLNQAVVAMAMANVNQARVRIDQAMEALKRVGSKIYLLIGYRVMARVCVEESRLEDAERAIRKGLELNASVEDPTANILLIGHRATVWRKRGEFKKARNCMNELREQVDALNRPMVTAVHLLDLAEIEIDSGNTVAATKCLDQVSRLIEEVGFNENSSVAVKSAALRARLVP